MTSKRPTKVQRAVLKALPLEAVSYPTKGAWHFIYSDDFGLMKEVDPRTLHTLLVQNWAAIDDTFRPRLLLTHQGSEALLQGVA